MTTVAEQAKQDVEHLTLKMIAHQTIVKVLHEYPNDELKILALVASAASRELIRLVGVDRATDILMGKEKL